MTATGERTQRFSPLGTTNYLYDGANLLADLDASGSVLSRYAQSKSLDEPLSELRSGMTSYYETDGVGSITSLMNSSATIVDSYTYDAFGNLSASTGSITNPFRYTGRESDPETGLYYYRARYYDPAIGRFTSEDPIWPAGDLNQFGYAKAGPINWIDPLGLKTYVIILYRNEDMSDIIGEHAALYIDNGGHPIIFDPGADTQPIGGGEHPPNDVFDVPDMMTLGEYVLEDRREHLYTEIIPFNTDDATEAEIAKRIKELTRRGGVQPTYCAKAVSRVLNGLGPFRDLGSYRRPAALARRLRELRAGGH